MFIALTTAKSSAQSINPAIINATGSNFFYDGAVYEWSIGEIAVVETMSNSRNIVTNGVLQPLFPDPLINEATTIVATNILSPNGDGKNDIWIIEDIEKYPDNEVTVFDRSGRTVYHTKNYKNTWNGTLSGLPLSENTYYYMIKVKKGNRYVVQKGYITIVN